MYKKCIETKNIPTITYNLVIESCEVGMIKPSIEIYKLAQNTCHQNPKNILFIDDKIEFLETATKLGWQTFHFNTNNPNESTIALRNILSI